MNTRNRILVLITLCILSSITFILIKKKYQAADSDLIKQINTHGNYDIIFGDPDCSNSIVVFIDYNCGYCRKFFNETFSKIDDHFIKTGKVKLVLKLVCNTTDLKALKAYQTAICFNQFGKYDKLHQLLIHENKIIYTNHFDELTDDLIASNPDIAECILNQNKNEILKNIYLFQELNTKGTPSFVVDNKIIIGYKDYSYWEKIIKNKFNL